MFFTVNLEFLDHLEDLIEVIDTPIDRNWMHEKQFTAHLTQVISN